MEVFLEGWEDKDFIGFIFVDDTVHFKCFEPLTENSENTINEILSNNEKFKKNVSYRTSADYGIMDFLEEEENGKFIFTANNYDFE